MKTTMTFILLAMMSTSLLAQNNNGYNNNNNGNNNGNGGTGNGQGARCVSKGTLDVKKAEREGTPEAPGDKRAKLDPCEKLKIIAIINDDPGSYETSDVSMTMDNKIQCRKDGGYTIDYNDCNVVKNLYNSAVLAEQAMFATQKIIQQEQNMKQQQDIADAAAKGDKQYAAIEAVEKRNKFNAQMNYTQATAYGAAVAALTSGLSAWDGKKKIIKFCRNPEKFKGLPGKVLDELAYEGFSAGECVSMADSYKSSPVFLNDDAKARFMMELGIFVQKSAEALRRAKMNERVADRMKDTVTKPDEETTAFDPCFSKNPPPECKKKGGKNISAGNFGSGATNFGSGTGTNQDFNFDQPGVDLGGDDTTTTGTDTEKIADVNSPFEKAAKDASGILDQAGKAQVSAAGDGGGGAGGGGGGGGGGGSASLGDDLAGASEEDSGDPDIKTTKSSGKYKAGGGGFNSVGKGGKEDANPFASMFDAKGEQGGVDEDRSIASDDGEASGLFHKISKKYGQVQQEKRVDSVNE